MRLRLVIWLTWWASAVAAQGFDAHWIGSGLQDSTQHVWFRKTFTTKEKPLRARLLVTTTGNCDVYVNEWNASRGLSTVNRPLPSNEPMTVSLDITNLLRTDSNTIALWYAPSAPADSHKQISATLFGTDRKGARFALYSDSSWLCKPSSRRLKADGSEAQDGKDYDSEWNTNRLKMALWRPASEFHSTQEPLLQASKAVTSIEKAVRVRSSKYFDVVGDTVFYEFGEPFHGFIRATLRNCKRGEIVHFDDFEYVCSGRIDEQAYPKFSRFYGKRIAVSGDKRFKREQIENLVVVETETINDLGF